MLHRDRRREIAVLVRVCLVELLLELADGAVQLVLAAPHGLQLLCHPLIRSLRILQLLHRHVVFAVESGKILLELRARGKKLRVRRHHSSHTTADAAAAATTTAGTPRDLLL
ncbi:hypothetical protein DQ04_15711010 [Trypanosoma grayi]|uniref:hypothetical protein n=1 Tax=Trypanosoma grayi TaxID=71804 RepID=UPI0004F41104|nr:hypothetical protein DQ04_15711010 [Trypanosoma grayi]KEG06139.1 hypothetical protein DQ04_15711010 [Trypanosoma grayi]